MAKQDINLGTAPSGLDGDDARTAFAKVNANFAELYDGTVLQKVNAKLTAIAESVWAANQMMYTTGLNTLAMTPLTAFARTILDDADAAAVRTTLGLGTAATATTTTSQTDSTANRSLKVGDFGLGTVVPPLLSSFLAADIPCGWYRGFGDGHASSTPGAPVGSGNAAISIFVGSGLSAAYTAFMVIVNAGSVSRIFFGNRATAGAAPVWGQSLNVGDYGIGSYAARLTGAEADAVAVIPSGFYDITPQTTAQWASTPFPSAWTRLMNISHNNASGYWTQLAFNFDVNPTIKVRGMSAGVRGSWKEVLTEDSGVTTGTAQEIGGQKTFTNSQMRHRSATPGLWMSPSNDSSLDDIWMVMSGNNLQWQRRANNFTSTLRSPTPMYLDLTSNVVRFGYSPIPISDSSASLGLSGYRWSVVYSATGAINTSDAREKTSVSNLNANEIAAAKALSKEIGTYKWLASIQEKGEDARLHVGMTVQRAVEIMEANDLDPMAYGFICYDSWDAVPENSYVEQRGYIYTLNEETEEEQVVVENVIEEGNAFPDTGVHWKYTHDETVVLNEAVPAGDRYSFRYDELNLFIAAGIEARLAALEEAMG
ncbi:tail fiber domain-containing protein [Pseudomonas putida]|uniref:tail fiber domain-containing protein n=1 Tax=Pseudomonas putida TaxID=303 RepID=UPI003CFC2FE6